MKSQHIPIFVAESCYFLWVFILLCLSTELTGQFYSQGEAPGSVKWEKIQTENFKLIYPKGFYDEANRFANMLEYYRPRSSYSLRNLPAKIPVVIHTQSVKSNGFVSWAPRRMEVVALPAQDHFAQDWFELLALHEYRHVVQVDKFRQGFTKGLSWFFGEMATGATSAYMTRWFLEGDAVVNETALSTAGRGRLPSFEMELRAVMLDSTKHLSYDQVFNGSYKHFIPDYYQYGYNMVSYIRVKYGPDFWENAINFSARNPYSLGPLSLYSLKQIGSNREKIYNDAMDSVRYIWRNQMKKIKANDYKIITDNNTKHYLQYELAQILSDKSIVALKTGIDIPAQIVRIDSMGKEQKLHEIGSSTLLNLSATDNYIIWNEIVGDPRWEGRSFSVIKSLHIHSGVEQQLTHKTRYFSPDISSDESKIIAVETDIEINNFLVLLQYPSGRILKRISSPGNKDLQYPGWINSKQVVLVTFNGKEKKIEMVDIETGEWKTIFSAGTMNVAEPVVWRNYTLFRASYNGIENIYAVDQLGNLFQITAAHCGAFHPAIAFGTNDLVYSNYTSKGFELAMISLDSESWIALPTSDFLNSSTIKCPVSSLNSPWPDKLKQQEMITRKRHKVVSIRSYSSKPYNKAANLFKFHSWLPFYLDIDENNISFDYKSIRPGFMIFSQNILSTAYSTLSYRYDNGYHIIRPSFTFRGWYPVLNIAAEIGGPARILPNTEGIALPGIHSNRKTFTAKAYIPLFYSYNRYRKRIQPQLEYEWSNTFYYNKNVLKSGLNSVHMRLYLYRYLRTTYRDLYPKWGQFLILTYTDTPFDDKQYGKLASAQADFYFPGIFNHHSFRLSTGYQKQWLQFFYLPINRIAFPRGYSAYAAEEFMKASANYSFPFLYPESSLSWFLYLKRMTSNFFCDISYGKNIQEISNGVRKSHTGIYNSIGIEMFLDIHAFRIMFPLQVGLRYSYLPARNSHDVEFMFSVNTDIF